MAAGCEFTQLRDHSYAQPCTSITSTKASKLKPPSRFSENTTFHFCHSQSVIAFCSSKPKVNQLTFVFLSILLTNRCKLFHLTETRGKDIFSSISHSLPYLRQFSILSLWDDYRVSVYPVIVPWLVPLMHIAVMSSVYSTILIR